MQYYYKMGMFKTQLMIYKVSFLEKNHWFIIYISIIISIFIYLKSALMSFFVLRFF